LSSTSENLAVADVGNLDMSLASVGKSDDEVEKNNRKVVLRSVCNGWLVPLALTYNPKGLILVVSSGPIADHSRATAKYDSSLTLNPITRALSTFITDTWRSCTERCIGIAEKEADEEGEKVKGEYATITVCICIHYFAPCYCIQNPYEAPHEPIW